MLNRVNGTVTISKVRLAVLVVVIFALGWVAQAQPTKPDLEGCLDKVDKLALYGSSTYDTPLRRGLR
jgi:hypothetical protein